MANRCINVDLSEFNEALRSLKKAGEDFQNEAAQWMDAVGMEFLNTVQDEILRRRVIDTSRLLQSFEKGGTDNIFEITDHGFTVEVGTNVEYASYVNDGHWTNPKGVMSRFVPGTWNGDKFTYDPNADGGMVLRQHWVEPKPYFDGAKKIFEKMFPEMLENKLEEWLKNYGLG